MIWLDQSDNHIANFHITFFTEIKYAFWFLSRYLIQLEKPYFNLIGGSIFKILNSDKYSEISHRVIDDLKEVFRHRF